MRTVGTWKDHQKTDDGVRDAAVEKSCHKPSWYCKNKTGHKKHVSQTGLK